ncbi:MAG: hypothetical protein IVW36_05780 [Dehalococcoidia bacterium]|nr:hypothetical protein [Dehalococcoidia bacterium]
MKPADLRGKQDVGSIVGLAYQIYAQNFLTLFAIALIVAPVELLTGVLQARFTSPPAQQAISLLTVPGALLTLLATAALIAALHEFTAGTKPAFSRALDVAFQRFGTMLSTLLLAAALAVAALLAVPFLTLWWLRHPRASIDGERNWWLALIPGALTLYLLVRWAVQQQAVIIEGRANWSALDSSAAAVRGWWWRTLGIIIVIGLIQAGPLLLSQAAKAGPPIIAGGVTSIVSALVLPFAVSAHTLLYYDLKARQHDAVSADRLTPAEPDLPG